MPEPVGKYWQMKRSYGRLALPFFDASIRLLHKRTFSPTLNRVGQNRPHREMNGWTFC